METTRWRRENGGAEEAREQLLRLAWSHVRHDPERVAAIPAARRAIAAGASPEDVSRAMGAAAYEAVFSLLLALDEGGDPYDESSDDRARQWGVFALPHKDHLVGLHEEVLTADPTGAEGADLFA